MIETITLSPGVRLRCFRSDRFKHGCLSVRFLREMRREEASLSALLPPVLLRGTVQYPDLRAIIAQLDTLYGAAVGTVIQRVGDYQVTGLYCSFLEDRFALPGDRVLAPVAALLEELLLRPALEDGAFRRDYVEGEKKNLISAIESERNDKRTYAAERLMRVMCQGDPFGIPRFGEAEQVAAVTPGSLFAHYQRVLRESPVELFYVGSAEAEAVAALLRPIFEKLPGTRPPLPGQTPFHDAGPGRLTETLDVTQARLAMGFVTPVTAMGGDFVPMQLCNLIFGGGLTSKLFMNVRERLSLCYDIGSGYYNTKGIVTVYAGLDADQAERAEQEILAQLAACQAGDITAAELTAAKEALRSQLLSVHDAPSAIENYYVAAGLAGHDLSPQAYLDAVQAAGTDAVAAAARSLRLHTVYLLKGVEA